MRADEKTVAKFLEGQGLRVEKFSKEELRESKTPDFRVYRENTFVFFCEVKSISEDRWLDDQLEGAKDGEVVGGARNDPIFNRITDDIHQAVKQFRAVNSRLIYPNILAFVNHDQIAGFHDLIGVLTGNFMASDGSADPIYTRYSKGRIKDEKAEICCYIWLEGTKQPLLFFGNLNSPHCSAVCSALVIDRSDIQQIG